LTRVIANETHPTIPTNTRAASETIQSISKMHLSKSLRSDSHSDRRNPQTVHVRSYSHLWRLRTPSQAPRKIESLSIYIPTHNSGSIFQAKRTYIYTYMHMYICIYIYIYIHNMYTYICTYIHTYTYPGPQAPKRIESPGIISAPEVSICVCTHAGTEKQAILVSNTIFSKQLLCCCRVLQCVAVYCKHIVYKTP